MGNKLLVWVMPGKYRIGDEQQYKMDGQQYRTGDA